MFVYRYMFWPEREQMNTFADSALVRYLGALTYNGQLSDDLQVVRCNEAVAVYCLCSDRDSLDDSHSSPLVRRSLAELAGLCSQPPQVEILGAATDLRSPCACPTPGSLIMFTAAMVTGPPVICGKCDGNVPLYRLPYYNDESDYSTILKWERLYKACHTLETLCSVGSRFGRMQTCSPGSALTTMGLDIRDDLARKTHLPVYYYTCADLHRPCKRCGSQWSTVGVPLPSRFHAVCEVCGFVT